MIEVYQSIGYCVVFLSLNEQSCVQRIAGWLGNSSTHVVVVYSETELNLLIRLTVKGGPRLQAISV